MKLMVIKVCGIPDVDNGDRMLDYLKIHFQRRSNCGADVLTVLPAPSPDQAYVVFETEEVPGVLKFNHVLEVDHRFYPIHVQRALQSEVDMPIETELSLRTFSNPQDVWLQLESNGFQIRQNTSGILHLKGSFLSLMFSQKQLAQLQAQDLQSKRTSSSSLSNGYSSAPVTQMEPNNSELTTAFKSSSNSRHAISNGVHTGSRKPMVDSASSRLAVSPARLDLTQSVSLEYGSSNSAGSPRSPPTFSDYSSRSRPPSSKRKEVSLVVEKDVLDYAFEYEEDVFKEIERVCEMTTIDDKEVTTLRFLGGNCEKGLQKFQACYEKLRPSLRVQEIDLNNYNPDQQMEIRHKIQLYKEKMSSVLIKQDGETVKLVGSSKASFEMKQRLLGHSAGPSTPKERGRTLERNSVQRSSSLPRQYKHKDWAADQELKVEPKYSGAPSDYQEEPQSRRAKGRPDEPQSRRRSNSESREQSKANRTKPKQPEEVPSPTSDEGKKSTNKILPNIKNSLGNIKLSKFRIKKK